GHAGERAQPPPGLGSISTAGSRYLRRRADDGALEAPCRLGITIIRGGNHLRCRFRLNAGSQPRTGGEDGHGRTSRCGDLLSARPPGSLMVVWVGHSCPTLLFVIFLALAIHPVWTG